MGSFKERVKEAPAPHAAPPSTALLPRRLGTGLAAVCTGGGRRPWGPSPVGGSLVAVPHLLPVVSLGVLSYCCLVRSVNPHCTDRDTRAVILGYAGKGTLSPPWLGQAGQPPASGRLGRVPALASSLHGPDILPVPLPALSPENGLFVGSGLDGQLTWPGRSSWREPRGDGCGGSQLGQPGAWASRARGCPPATGCPPFALHGLSLQDSPRPHPHVSWAPGTRWPLCRKGQVMPRGGGRCVAHNVWALAPRVCWGADSSECRGLSHVQRGRGKPRVGEVGGAGGLEQRLVGGGCFPLGQSQGWVGAWA